jgi:hypothetical protein
VGRARAAGGKLMAIAAHSYGGAAGVAAFVKHLTDKTSGLFTTTTKPTLAEVEGFLDQQSAQLNAWLAAYQYVIPVSQADAKLLLDKFANIGAAGLAELTQRAAGYAKNPENNRENVFLAQFEKAQAFIASGSLASLGAAQSAAAGPFLGLFTGGKTAGGQALRPIFRRTSFGNDPTAESGTDEPDI